MKSVKSWSLVFLLAASSCLLETPEDNFVNVQKVSNLTFLSDVLYSANEASYYPLIDTLWISDFASLRLSGGNLYDFQMLVNNDVVCGFGSEAQECRIEKNGRASGVYDLTVIQRVKSGTGSLADNYNAEYAEYQHVYKLVVTRADAYVPEITDIRIANGTVQVKWKPFRQGNFQGFRLLKYLDSDYTPYRIMSFPDRTKTFLNDSTYVGRKISYVLEVNQGGKISYSVPKVFNIAYDPKFKLTQQPNGTLRLSWSNPPYFKNIRYSKVYQQQQIVQDNIEPTVLYTEFNGTLLFGEARYFTLSQVAKGTENSIGSGDRGGASESLLIGERITPFANVKYNAAKNQLFLSYQPTMQDGVRGYYKLDHNYHVLDSVIYPYDPFKSSDPYSVIVSANGEHLYTLGKYAILQQRDVNNLASVVTYKPYDFGSNNILDSFDKIDNFAVSNNNFLLLRTESPANYNKDVADIIDMNLKQRIFSLDNVAQTHLSSDAMYFVNGADLYKKNGGTYALNVTLPYTNIVNVQFLDDEPSHLVVLTKNKIIIYNCSSHSEISAWDYLPLLSSIPHLDQSSKKVAYVTSFNFSNLTRTWSVFDLTSGNRKEVTVWGEWITFEGNAFMDKRGFALKNY